MVDAFLGIKYKLTESVKFDEYMKELGVGLINRKMGGAVSPVIELSKTDDGYVMTSTTSVKTHKFKITLNGEDEDVQPDGRKTKSKWQIDGAKIIEHQTGPDGKVSVLERTWSKDSINMTLKAGNVVCTRVYKAV